MVPKFSETPSAKKPAAIPRHSATGDDAHPHKHENDDADSGGGSSVFPVAVAQQANAIAGVDTSNLDSVDSLVLLTDELTDDKQEVKEDEAAALVPNSGDSDNDDEDDGNAGKEDDNKDYQRCPLCTKTLTAGAATCRDVPGLEDCFSRRPLCGDDEALIQACKNIHPQLVAAAEGRQASNAVSRARTSALATSELFSHDVVLQFLDRNYLVFPKIRDVASRPLHELILKLGNYENETVLVPSVKIQRGRIDDETVPLYHRTLAFLKGVCKNLLIPRSLPTGLSTEARRKMLIDRIQSEKNKPAAEQQINLSKSKKKKGKKRARRTPSTLNRKPAKRTNTTAFPKDCHVGLVGGESRKEKYERRAAERIASSSASSASSTSSSSAASAPAVSSSSTAAAAASAFSTSVDSSSSLLSTSQKNPVSGRTKPRNLFTTSLYSGQAKGGAGMVGLAAGAAKRIIKIANGASNRRVFAFDVEVCPDGNFNSAIVHAPIGFTRRDMAEVALFVNKEMKKGTAVILDSQEKLTNFSAQQDQHRQPSRKRRLVPAKASTMTQSNPVLDHSLLLDRTEANK